MAPYENRLGMLEARCSVFAAELLRQLHHHPRFSELMDILEAIDGPIYRGDVENALMQVNEK
ncbi:MAG TPA: hypothetical protein VFK15_06425 [Burkholderiales bacterium]|jgi:hypothetical protein|nr:hypothetical protein [Burkholderiales bacterium]